MVERIRAVLTTYARRSLPGYMAFACLPLMTVLILFAASPLGRLRYLIAIAPPSAILSLFVGRRLNHQFASYRCRLIPWYAAAHIWAAVLLSVAFAAVLVGEATVFAFFDSVPEAHLSFASAIAVFAMVWFVSVLFLWIGYFAAFVALFTPLILTTASLDERVWAFTGKLAEGEEPQWAFLLLFLSLTLSLALVGRMLHFREGQYEGRWKLLSVSDMTIRQREAWTRYDDSTWRRLFASRRINKLDRVELPIKPSFLSHVLHFERGLDNVQLAFLPTLAMMVMTFWMIGMFGLGNAAGAMIGVFTLLPAATMLVRAHHLQLVLMLPLRREQFVVRYGAALFLHLLRTWLLFLSAAAIVDWMPAPGTFGSVPSLLTIMNSFAVQLPLFGALTLLWLRKRWTTILSLMLYFAILLPMSGDSRVLGLALSMWVFPVIAVAVGVALILLSYRNWRDIEVG